MAAIKALHWTGRAQVFAGGKQIDLIVETRVEPFVRAWTSSYRVGEAPSLARRLRVEGDMAFVLRDDLETDLFPAQARHEREQYGLYGYLLRTLIRQKLLVQQGKGEKLFLAQDSQPGFPPIEFRWDVRGQRIGEAGYIVHAPSGEGKIQQQIAFSGTIGDPDLGWPRTIDIAQDGKPYFKLVLESFTIQLA